MSLYDDLGVTKDADHDALRAAYRERAKETHPDIGGDPDEFRRVHRAWATLKDDARRAKYDATGEIDDKASVGEFEDSLSLIMPMIYATVSDFIDGRGNVIDPEKQGDLLDKAKEKISRFILTSIVERARVKRTGEKFAAMAKRFRRHGGKRSPIADALESEARRCERGLAEFDETIAVNRAAIALIDEHDFFADIEAERSPYSQGIGFAYKLAGPKGKLP